MKKFIIILLALSFFGMASSNRWPLPSPTSSPYKSPSPSPVHSPSPTPTPKIKTAAADESLVDLRVVSIDVIGDTIAYNTDFGNYIEYIPFTIANDSDIDINAFGKFTIFPVGNPGAPNLVSSMAYKPMPARSTGVWDNFDSMPVYYGPGDYQLTFCVYPYDTSAVPQPITDAIIANNCMSKVFTLLPQ